MSQRSLLQEKNTWKVPGTFKHTAMVSHGGMVVAFGMDDPPKIKYSVLNLQASRASANNKECWSDLQGLEFPNELAQSGYGMIQNFELPRANSDGKPVDNDSIEKADAFYSSTAKYTATHRFKHFPCSSTSECFNTPSSVDRREGVDSKPPTSSRDEIR